MPRLDRTQDVVQRLRGHWRLSLSEPLWGRSAILAMNRVLDDEAEARLPHRAGWCLGPDSFRQLLESLSESAQIVSLESVLQLHHDQLPRIALTFDGGWRDTLKQVSPALERLALPANVFLPCPVTQRAWSSWHEAIGEALWRDETADHARRLLAEAGLPAPPTVGTHRDERYSQAIRNYIAELDQSQDATALHAVASALDADPAFADEALDAFSIRRLEQGGLFRFGSLIPPHATTQDVSALIQLRESQHQLAVLCRHPLRIATSASAHADEGLARLAASAGIERVLTHRTGWLEPPIDTVLLPRFAITQPVANSPGRLFDWLLGNLPS
ncbi:MAG: polysaccharide deacetylase [Salinicola sp.]|uniref:polysaccharide deacetylase family protein n=1 Tax=Salinicola sp. TaxID=1978524 RepID=UPI000C8F4941|nr:polysaccharide deacetylase family protein [Salinicola sp.]MAM56853.1 polysaccharide deacetylase [Salinicola sp.]NRB56553.1 polysaccharide deacetylase family protein [Salinicola sp.]